MTIKAWIGSVIFWMVMAVPAGTPWAIAQKTKPERIGAEGNRVSVSDKTDRSLIAHWTFDESSGSDCADSSGHGLTVSLENPAAGFARTRGVHGRALNLRGEYALRAKLNRPDREWPAITFSAWVRPTDLSSFREIFRQECPNRLLFSFQDNGTILSLGLNIGGYLECDAPVQPESILDGMWHHCAASFDGEWMRVYLDGRQIGSLPRPGKIAVSPEVPAYIGSSSGGGEFFQGMLDDLRIYDRSLGPEEISGLYQKGNEALKALAAEMEKAVRPFYPTGKSFAETLALTRQRIAETGTDMAYDLALAVQAKIRVNFSTECTNFANWTGIQPIEYLTHADSGFQAQLAGWLVELALEYRPLTERQWKNQPPDAVQKWQELGKVKQHYDRLVAGGEAARFSPEWIEVIMAAGPQVQFRPSINEAVAPYITPQTPETRTLSAAQARQILERDWLHQASQNPTTERIKQEIGWARQLVERILANCGSTVDFTDELAELETVAQQVALTAAPDRDLYLKVREVKRAVMFKNPVVDFDQVLFVDMPFPQGSEWQHETRHRLGYMAVPGARLLTLDGLRPDGKLTQIMPQAPLHGSFWRPDLSWDARKVLFCFKPHNEKSFHLYEINVDGTSLVQLTDGPFDDLDPVYLPDEQHIVFSTTRGHTYVRCMPPTNAFVLARGRRDGGDLYLISANNEPDYLPSVMNDGRVVYTRWEYTDKPLWRAQKLWTVNPDGTQVLMHWGNQSVWPDLMKDARSIPGSGRVMFTGSAHHNWFSGSIGIVDHDSGFNFPSGLTKITADMPWPECGNGPVDPIESPHYHASGDYEAYYSPYPLSEQDFIVSANRGGKFVLYLMDVEGNRELIYEGTHHVLHAMPLKPRTKPPAIQDRVIWPTQAERERPADGILFSNNVYQGAPPELRDKARFLRIFSIDAKTYTYWYKRPYISTGPVVSAVQSEGVKRLLGMVPIEKDGSIAFRAPAGVPLHFQLLDEQQRALHTMRSFVNVMPGEQRGCLGCHESSSRTPEGQGNSIAITKAPQPITPPPWTDTTVSYPRYVQPVLDRYCGKCHQGDGEGRKTLDLTERPGSPVFTEPYLTLIGRPSWGTPYSAPEKPVPGFGIAGMLMVEGYSTVDPKAYITPPPMASLSYRSPLIERVSSGKHHDVKVDEISRLRLIVWVDAMCPYMGDDEIREIPDPVFQGVDWLAIRPRIQTAPRVTRPGPVD
jgi:hypothetical protein